MVAEDGYLALIRLYNRYLALTKVLVINLFYREGTTNHILSKTQKETSNRQVSSIHCKHRPKLVIYEENK